MLKFLRTASIILILAAALLGPSNGVNAGQLNKSAKDWIENPDTFKEKKAEKTEQVSTYTETKVGVTFSDFLRMIFATIFVVGLLYFLLKFINKKSISYKSSQLVENLGGTSLGANRSVQIVKAGNKLLIVGVGENIQLLKEIDDPEEYSQIIKEYNGRMDQLVQPSDIVTKFLKRTNKDSSKENTPFSLLLKNQLNEISSGRKKLLEEVQKKGSEKNE